MCVYVCILQYASQDTLIKNTHTYTHTHTHTHTHRNKYTHVHIPDGLFGLYACVCVWMLHYVIYLLAQKRITTDLSVLQCLPMQQEDNCSFDMEEGPSTAYVEEGPSTANIQEGNVNKTLIVAFGSQ